MAIGRISGPMLLPNLERQGVDLSFDGNLVYFDVTQRRVGINTNSPVAALEVIGNVRITSDVDIVNGNLFVGGGNVNVGNYYILPNVAPTGPGQTIYSLGGSAFGASGPFSTFWGPGNPEGALRRRKYEKEITTLLGYGNVDINIELGVSSVIYNLSVSRPCKVEAFGTANRSDPNPYTFIATPDHLTDDGTVILNDGSSFQSRQYSIWANLEEPPTANIYVRISSLDQYQASTPLLLTLLYYPAVTDSRPGVEIMATFPSIGYEGKIVFLTTTNRLYIYANGQWVAI
jgi:hypothetical protein